MTGAEFSLQQPHRARITSYILFSQSQSLAKEWIVNLTGSPRSELGIPCARARLHSRPVHGRRLRGTGGRSPKLLGGRDAHASIPLIFRELLLLEAGQSMN